VGLIGHEDVRRQLEDELPPVVLLEGAAGIGKRLVAYEVAERIAKPTELLEVGMTLCTGLVNETKHDHPQPECEVLTAAVSRYLVSRCQIKPMGKRAVVFDAGKATSDALNILLKLLEEPPANTYFLMYASRPVLPTVVSRAARFQLQPLQDADVIQLLNEHHVPADRAARAARWASGRPGRALEVEEALKYSAAVLELLKAAAHSDRLSLSAATRALRPASDDEWSEARHRSGETRRAELTAQLLIVALGEARTSTWRMFQAQELQAIQQLGERVLDRALRALGTTARSELKVRAAVEGLSAAAERGRR
jgi:hypothetical protein